MDTEQRGLNTDKSKELTIISRRKKSKPHPMCISRDGMARSLNLKCQGLRVQDDLSWNAIACVVNRKQKKKHLGESTAGVLPSLLYDLSYCIITWLAIARKHSRGLSLQLKKNHQLLSPLVYRTFCLRSVHSILKDSSHPYLTPPLGTVAPGRHFGASTT